MSDFPETTPNDRVEVAISDTQGHLRIAPSAIIELVRRTLRLEGRMVASISIALVDDASIHEINRQYLGHDWPTDVITFPLSSPDDPELSAELVVSAEMARKTAEAAGGDPWAELALYLVHGLLHLCGQDDQTDEQRAAMRRREAEVLAALGIGPPTIATEAQGGMDWRP